jgi:hypothetical protein
MALAAGGCGDGSSVEFVDESGLGLTPDHPFRLTVDVTAVFAELGPDEAHYYTFSTGAGGGDHLGVLSNLTADMLWALFASGDFSSGAVATTPSAPCDNDAGGTGNEICTAPALAAATPYFLKVGNQEPVQAIYRLHVFRD